MLGAVVKAINQFSDPAIRRVLWIAIAAAVLVFAALWTGVGYVLSSTTLFEMDWLNEAVAALGWILTLVLTWFLFPGVASAVVGVFLEDVAAAVETRHYPRLPAVRPQPVAEAVFSAVKFLGVVILFNVLSLFSLIPPFTPLFPFVFYGLNGYLLGREYFELVAFRRLEPMAARALRKRNQGRLLLVGVGFAFLLTVPVVNLVAPIIATAAMVHLFEDWRDRAGLPVARG